MCILNLKTEGRHSHHYHQTIFPHLSTEPRFNFSCRSGTTLFQFSLGNQTGSCPFQNDMNSCIHHDQLGVPKFQKVFKISLPLDIFCTNMGRGHFCKKMIFFAFSSLGHHVEKNGPCSRENEVKISKNRFLAIKSCRNMLQPSS